MEYNKEFNEDDLNVAGYSKVEINNWNAFKRRYADKPDFEFDLSSYADVIENKGIFYAFINKEKKVKAIYISTKEDMVFSCTERLLSDSIADDPAVEKMDEFVKFLVARRASYYKTGKGCFMGEELPELKQKSEGFNVAMAIVFAIIYSMIFSQAMDGPSGIGVGISLGVCMGFCFAKHSYIYEAPKEEETGG